MHRTHTPIYIFFSPTLLFWRWRLWRFLGLERHRCHCWVPHWEEKTEQWCVSVHMGFKWHLRLHLWFWFANFEFIILDIVDELDAIGLWRPKIPWCCSCNCGCGLFYNFVTYHSCLRYCYFVRCCGGDIDKSNIVDDFSLVNIWVWFFRWRFFILFEVL